MSSVEEKNPYLAQILLRYVGPTTACQAVGHRQSVPGEWELRFYQDSERALHLLQEGKPREEIDQLLWEEGCREQDTVGVHVHQVMTLCESCATAVATSATGGYRESPAGFMGLVNARVVRGALLLVTDRETGYSAIVGNVPGSVREEDILPMLRRKDLIDIRFKS